MKIKQITNQHRRDFSAIMQCESCKTTTKLNSGYDDRNYHDNVIPAMKCTNCGESSISLKSDIEITQTKYPAGLQL